MRRLPREVLEVVLQEAVPWEPPTLELELQEWLPGGGGSDDEDYDGDVGVLGPANGAAAAADVLAVAAFIS